MAVPTNPVVRARAREEAARLVAELGAQGAYDEAHRRHGARRLALERARGWTDAATSPPEDHPASWNALRGDHVIEYLSALSTAIRRREFELARGRARGTTYAALDKLAWQATAFTGARGRESLQVLQDALETLYAPLLEAARRQALRGQKKTGDTHAVLFCAGIERAHRTYGARGSGPPSPFQVTRGPWTIRDHCPVVWDTFDGSDVHDWAGYRREVVAKLGDRRGRVRYEDGIAYVDYWRRQARRVPRLKP